MDRGETKYNERKGGGRRRRKRDYPKAELGEEGGAVPL